MLEKLKKLEQQCFEGEVVMPKVMFWLIVLVCLLAGVVYGLRVAPMTHGMTIASNNGNQSHCSWGGKCEKEESETETEEEAL